MKRRIVRSHDELPVFETGTLVAGVDEAGRGPLAGDVVAAAVILDATRPIEGLADSKRLSERARESLFGKIHELALAVAVGRASVVEIDDINILHASMLAMKRAVQGLVKQPQSVLVDGNRLPGWEYNGFAIVKGDDRVAAISAASIVAKVVRDREMKQLATKFPDYGFERHKGYPTAAHIAALEQHGITEYHRRSFGPVARLAQNECADLP